MSSYNDDFSRKAHIKKKAGGVLSYLIKLSIGLLMISPLLIGLVFSFVPNKFLENVPTLQQIRDNLTLDNYKFVIGYVPIFRYLLNTFINCLIIVVSQIILACMAAYAFAFFEFKGKNFIFNAILVAMMIPGEVTVIANYLTAQSWGLINTHFGLALTFLIGGQSIYMMRQCFLQIPKEIREATIVDGCGNFRFLIQMAIPMSIPSISSLAIYQFIGAFNHYFWPMLIAQKKEMQTIQIGMAMLIGTENQEYGSILAGAMICILIPAIVFIIGQDYIIKGMTDGAVKG